jgi:hypothetical protein
MVLFKNLQHRRAPLWALPLVMLAWANLHGGFLAGLGALGLAILLRASENLAAFGWSSRRLTEGTQRLWLTLAASIAVTFVNPLGPRLWAYIITEVAHGTNRRYIEEWAPPSLHRDAWSMIVLTLIVVTLAVVGWAAHRREQGDTGPPAACWIASCMPLIAMSYLSVRHVPLAAIWTGPVITLLAARIDDRHPQGAAFRRSWFVLRGLAVLPACLTCFVVYSDPRPNIRVDGTVLGPTRPCGAVAFLRDQGARGNLYNPLWWGAYITWELYPAVRVSMDGRNVSLFSDEMVLENLKFYTDDVHQADIDVPLRYATDFLIVPTGAPVLSRLLADSRWRRGYADSDSVLFERAGAGASRLDRSATKTACKAVLE